ncbi:hypothetical protein M885DRAFT_538731, partial [Pelagophyceae sp. CCMP2097]
RRLRGPRPESPCGRRSSGSRRPRGLCAGGADNSCGPRPTSPQCLADARTAPEPVPVWLPRRRSLWHPCRRPCRLRADVFCFQPTFTRAPSRNRAVGRLASAPTLAVFWHPCRRSCGLRFGEGCCADNSCGPRVHAPTTYGRRPGTIVDMFFLDLLSTCCFHNIRL